MSCLQHLVVSSQNWCMKKLHLSFIPVTARSYSSPTSKPSDQLYIFSNDWTSLYVITCPPCWSYLQPDFHKDYFFSYIMKKGSDWEHKISTVWVSWGTQTLNIHFFLLQLSMNRISFSKKNKSMFSNTSF